MTTWKDIDGYNGKYQVSDSGTVRSVKRVVKYKSKHYKDGSHHTVPSRILSQRDGWDGYKCVSLWSGNKSITYYVHRLVAMSFIKNPHGHEQVNHKDGDPLNNHVDNLEWCNQSKNTQHAFDNGLNPIGEKHGRSKLTEHDVLSIRELYTSGNYSSRRLGEMYNVSNTCILQIIKRLTWKHI